MNASPFFRALLIAVPVASFAACGGVVETSGTSSSGTSSSSSGASSSGSTSTSSTSSGTTADCDELFLLYAVALDKAQQCNACADFDGCINGPVFVDICQCPVVANSANAAAIEEAKAAYATWSAAGCQHPVCGMPCFAGTMGWSCTLTSPGTCDGTCAPP